MSEVRKILSLKFEILNRKFETGRKATFGLAAPGSVQLGAREAVGGQSALLQSFERRPLGSRRLTEGRSYAKRTTHGVCLLQGRTTHGVCLLQGRGRHTACVCYKGADDRRRAPATRERTTHGVCLLQGSGRHRAWVCYKGADEARRVSATRERTTHGVGLLQGRRTRHGVCLLQGSGRHRAWVCYKGADDTRRVSATRETFVINICISSRQCLARVARLLFTGVCGRKYFEGSSLIITFYHFLRGVSGTEGAPEVGSQ